MNVSKSIGALSGRAESGRPRRTASGRTSRFYRGPANGRKPRKPDPSARRPRDVTAGFGADHFRLAYLRFPLMM